MRWPVQVVEATGSTNADLLTAAAVGDAGPRVLAARQQHHGRGRLERTWSSPPGASVSVSWLWRPEREQQAWPWLPMVVGLGAHDAARALGVGAVGLKWPNDVVVVDDPPGPAVGAMTGLRKLAGVLVEVAAGSTPGAARGRGGSSGDGAGTPCVVAGVGLNVGLGAEDLPVPTATSVLLRTGRDPGFDAALAALVDAVGARLETWRDEASDAALRRDYRAACTTLGREVRVSTPGGAVHGRAEDVDDDGCLVVRTVDGARVRVSAGDVEHVR